MHLREVVLEEQEVVDMWVARMAVVEEDMRPVMKRIAVAHTALELEAVHTVEAARKAVRKAARTAVEEVEHIVHMVAGVEDIAGIALVEADLVEDIEGFHSRSLVDCIDMP